MSTLVQVDFIEPDESETRIIERIIPVEREDVSPITHGPPTKIETAVKPPPLPPFDASKVDTTVPASTYTGSTPHTPEFDLASIIVPTQIRPDREPIPLEPPVVSYPSRELAQGIEGECLVYFNIDVSGLTSNIQPDCPSAGFTREARRAISRTRFAPRIVDGEAVRQIGVVYPISFRILD
ncbi:MAG: TonB family protein [Pseudomonadota bacterium]